MIDVKNAAKIMLIIKYMKTNPKHQTIRNIRTKQNLCNLTQCYFENSKTKTEIIKQKKRRVTHVIKKLLCIKLQIKKE